MTGSASIRCKEMVALTIKSTTPGPNWHSSPALRGAELFYSAAGRGRTIAGNLPFVYDAVNRLTGEELCRH